MQFTLIICTYKRAMPLLQLLNSVKEQTLYPNEIIIVDGSSDDATKEMLENTVFNDVRYYKVLPDERGLTKQRNYGIAKVDASSEIVCFLDDDTVLETNYFEEIIAVFALNNLIAGVGGVAINEYNWYLADPLKNYNSKKFYSFEGFVIKEALRNKIRNYLLLDSGLLPSKMPEFSHGRTCGYPLTGKEYEVDLLVGMSMAFRKIVVDSIRFSTYFEGYGLYEDADFSIRSLEFGKNVIATKAQLSHYHDASGRPNQYQYGKMVVRNGWYVWRVKNPKPLLHAKLKWHAITIVLTLIRFSNAVTSTKRKQAFTEAIGRTVGWWSLLFNKPK